jgi:hypothetical protein
MRTIITVDPDDTRWQHSDAALPKMDFAAPAAHPMLLAQQPMPMDLAPGTEYVIPRVFAVPVAIEIGGWITSPLDLVKKFPTANFYRSETRKGAFTRVVSLTVAERPIGLFRGPFVGQINRGQYPTLFPGFFMVGLRNPKANPMLTLFLGATVSGM